MCPNTAATLVSHSFIVYLALLLLRKSETSLDSERKEEKERGFPSRKSKTVMLQLPFLDSQDCLPATRPLPEGLKPFSLQALLDSSQRSYVRRNGFLIYSITSNGDFQNSKLHSGLTHLCLVRQRVICLNYLNQILLVETILAVTAFQSQYQAKGNLQKFHLCI